MNFVEGRVEGGAGAAAALSSTPLALPSKNVLDGSEVIFGVRPQHLKVDPAGESHTVDLVESLGGVSYVYLIAASGERLTVELGEDDPMPSGAKVGLTFDPAKMMLFDRKTEMRIR